MTQMGWVLLGWAVVIGAITLYAVSVILRGRQLATRVPQDRRRWMNSPDMPADTMGPTT
jgi:hypothetical protein